MEDAYLTRLVHAYTELLRAERRTGLSKREIARRLTALLGEDVAEQTAGRWVRGEVQPRDSGERRAFAAVLGVSAGWLFYGEGTAQPLPKPAPTAAEHAARTGAKLATPVRRTVREIKQAAEKKKGRQEGGRNGTA